MFLLQMIKDCGQIVSVKFKLRDELRANGVQDACKEYHMYSDYKLIWFSIGAVANRRMVTLYKRDGCSLINNNKKRKEVITRYRYGELQKLNIQIVDTSSNLLQSRAFLTDSKAPSNALKTKSLQTWHNRYCHLNNDYVKITLAIVIGLTLPSTQGDNYFCEGCV